MVNKVILIGNLGKDPELTYTPSGVALTKVSLATTEKWTNRDGEKQETTEWHNLVFWRRQAEVANEFLRKGSRIYVEGRIRYRQFEGSDGQTRHFTDIEVQNFQMLSSRGESASGSSGGSSGGGQRRSQSQSQSQQGGGGRPSGGSRQNRSPQNGDTHYEPIDNNDRENDSFGTPDDDLPF